MAAWENVFPYKVFALGVGCVPRLRHGYALKYSNTTLWFQQFIDAFKICIKEFSSDSFEHFDAHQFVIESMIWRWESSVIAKENLNTVREACSLYSLLRQVLLFLAQRQACDPASCPLYRRNGKTAPACPNLQDMIRFFYSCLGDKYWSLVS